MSETTAILKVSGMHCRSCSALIDMTVDELDGVSSVRTDHESGETVVTFDPDAVTIDAIIEAIRGVGYEAETAA